MCGVSVCERERLHTFSRRLGRELHLTRGSEPALRGTALIDPNTWHAPSWLSLLARAALGDDRREGKVLRARPGPLLALEHELLLHEHELCGAA